MSGDDVFTGEYFVSLKNYKIPLKSTDKSNDPPPPGTENEIDTFSSPLTALNRPPQPKFQAPTPTSPPTQTSPSKPTKRSSLFMMPSAEGLPEELIKLFKPLCCDLCSTKLNSPSSARLHYESKNHEKKINSWLATWSEQTGTPIPKRQAPNKDAPKGPNAFHCDICDLALTSLQHVKQHNMGKKHKNAVAGRGKPGGSGYYDSNNQWVRTAKIAEDPTNRFYIGEAFLLKKDSDTETVIVPESVLKTTLTPPPPPPPETFPKIDNDKSQSDPFRSGFDFDIAPDYLVEPPPLTAAVDVAKEIVQMQNQQTPPTDLGKYCELCDIHVTSEMHMRLHLSGSKHAKKLRQLGEPPYAEVPHTLSQCINDEVALKRPKTITAPAGSAVDYSVFRTPSGQYYCKACDLSVTSEVTLSQHFASKRHQKSAKKKP